MKNQQILELYFNSNDNRIRIIAEIVNLSAPTVSKVITEFFQDKIDYQPQKMIIFHSKMNDL